ncbi:protein kinase family protein [Frankia torreyi]|uniref:non-specific serine/threonine protein kinase n=1 Tax=Frankia torreyi TaxID=1856 RepID=A0A0D8B6N3_9ACTN|nr:MULTISPECIES: serine/threonine-protein kinase [Frankia]KJE19750.1 protein kinase family protein [Frankia torreyi]KQC38348.1 serine/threonine protein kinase [Frankia sp. ACN1ag]KQM02263.1 protein kinase family protein [Frankia sp. CpI1-P]
MSWKALRAGDPPEVGPYRLMGRLGSGGMGIVYLGVDDTGTRAAVKVMREEHTADTAFRHRFHREAAAVAAIDSPRVARLLAADVDGDQPWIATEYVAGPTLYSSVATGGPLSGEALWEVARGLAEALCAIHDADVVHRDLKPGNVMLAADGPKVIDFGIVAGLPGMMTASGVVMGSIGYLAPELLTTTRRPRPAADIFSWGLTVCFAASGRPPFGGGPLDALLYRTVHGEADLSGLPGPLRGVVAASLRKKPERRPDAHRILSQIAATAGAVAADGADAGVALPGGRLPVTRLRAAGGEPNPTLPRERRATRRPRTRRGVLVPGAGATAVAAAVTAAILLASAPAAPPNAIAAGGAAEGDATNSHPAGHSPAGVSPGGPSSAGGGKSRIAAGPALPTGAGGPAADDPTADYLAGTAGPGSLAVPGTAGQPLRGGIRTGRKFLAAPLGSATAYPAGTAATAGATTPARGAGWVASTATWAGAAAAASVGGADPSTTTGAAGGVGPAAAAAGVSGGSAPAATTREVDFPAPAQQSGPATTPTGGAGAATTTPSGTAAATATARRIAAAFTTGSATGRTTSTCLPGGPWGPPQFAAGCGGALALPAIFRAATAPPPWSTALAEGIPRLIAAAVSSEAPWDELD